MIYIYIYIYISKIYISKSTLYSTVYVCVCVLSIGFECLFFSEQKYYCVITLMYKSYQFTTSYLNTSHQNNDVMNAIYLAGNIPVTSMIQNSYKEGSYLFGF